MSDGLHRGDVDYVWPRAVIQPQRPPARIYLDLNHWIGLAKADTHHAESSRYTPLLEAAQEACDRGAANFPLSGPLYGEMAAITDPRQRSAVGRIMERLSDFATLLTRSLVVGLEVDAAIEHLMGKPRAKSIEPISLIGRSIGHATGGRRVLRLREENGDDATERLRSEWAGGPDAFDQWFVETELSLQREELVGSDRFDSTSRAMEARYVQEQRAQQESEFARQLNLRPHLRKGRLRDLVMHRYVMYEVNSMIFAATDARDTSGIMAGAKLRIDRLTRSQIVDSMPTGDVYVTLMTAAHRDANTRWSRNDIYDIDALSIAVPYCDIVATDRQRSHELRATGLAERLGTQVVAAPEQLLPLLRTLA